MCLLEVMTFHLLFDIHLADKNGFSYFNIAYIWHQIGCTITIDQSVWFQRRVCPEFF